MFVAQIFIKITYRAYRSPNRCEQWLTSHYLVLYCWWLVELHYWLKAALDRTFWEFFTTWGKINDWTLKHWNIEILWVFPVFWCSVQFEAKKLILVKSSVHVGKSGTQKKVPSCIYSTAWAPTSKGALTYYLCVFSWKLRTERERAFLAFP